jgi:hypothetical protein
MGVDRTDYLVIGWKLNKDLYRELSDDAIMSGYFIYDVMCGEYLVFGKIIAHAEEPDGFYFTEIKPESLILMNNEIYELKQTFKELTGRQLMECIESDIVPKAMLFSHFW